MTNVWTTMEKAPVLAVLVVMVMCSSVQPQQTFLSDQLERALHMSILLPSSSSLTMRGQGQPSRTPTSSVSVANDLSSSSFRSSDAALLSDGKGTTSVNTLLIRRRQVPNNLPTRLIPSLRPRPPTTRLSSFTSLLRNTVTSSTPRAATASPAMPSSLLNFRLPTVEEMMQQARRAAAAVSIVGAGGATSNAVRPQVGIAWSSSSFTQPLAGRVLLPLSVRIQLARQAAAAATAADRAPLSTQSGNGGGGEAIRMSQARTGSAAGQGTAPAPNSAQTSSQTPGRSSSARVLPPSTSARLEQVLRNIHLEAQTASNPVINMLQSADWVTSFLQAVALAEARPADANPSPSSETTQTQAKAPPAQPSLSSQNNKDGEHGSSERAGSASIKSPADATTESPNSISVVSLSSSSVTNSSSSGLKNAKPSNEITGANEAVTQIKGPHQQGTTTVAVQSDGSGSTDSNTGSAVSPTTSSSTGQSPGFLISHGIPVLTLSPHGGVKVTVLNRTNKLIRELAEGHALDLSTNRVIYPGLDPSGGGKKNEGQGHGPFYVVNVDRAQKLLTLDPVEFHLDVLLRALGEQRGRGLKPADGSLTGGLEQNGGSAIGGLKPVSESASGGLKPVSGSAIGGLKPVDGSPTGGLEPNGGSVTGGLKPVSESATGGLEPVSNSPTSVLPLVSDSATGGLEPVGSSSTTGLKPASVSTGGSLESAGSWLTGALKSVVSWLTGVLEPVSTSSASGLKPVGGPSASGLEPVSISSISSLEPVGSSSTSGLKPVGGLLASGLETVSGLSASGLKPVSGSSASGLEPVSGSSASGLEPVSGSSASGLASVGSWSHDGPRLENGFYTLLQLSNSASSGTTQTGSSTSLQDVLPPNQISSTSGTSTQTSPATTQTKSGSKTQITASTITGKESPVNGQALPTLEIMTTPVYFEEEEYENEGEERETILATTVSTTNSAGPTTRTPAKPMTKKPASISIPDLTSLTPEMLGRLNVTSADVTNVLQILLEMSAISDQFLTNGGGRGLTSQEAVEIIRHLTPGGASGTG